MMYGRFLLFTLLLTDVLHGPAASPRYRRLVVALVEAQEEHRIQDYDAYFFEQMVADTIQNLQELVDDSRKYVLLEHEEHTYEDKFALVEYMTHAAWKSLADAYEMLGFDIVQLLLRVHQQQKHAPKSNSSNIILYFEGAVQCNFIEERQAEVIGNGHETIKTSYGGQVTSKEERTIHRYTEYVWNVTQYYHVFACLSSTEENDVDGDSPPSTDSSCKDIDDDATMVQRVDIARRSMSTNVISQVKDSAPVRTVLPTMERIRLPAWWIQQMTMLNNSSFVIHRELKSCKTPRRNEDVQKVLDFHEHLYQWHGRIIHFLHHQLYIKPHEQRPSSWYNMDEQWPAALFHHPILPIVLSENSTTTEPASSILLPASHMNRILAEQKQLLQQKVDALKQDFPHPNDKPDAMLSIAEATLHLRLQHLNSLLVFHGQGVGHVEEMLRQQLAEAVGKQLQAQDFRDYMEFHNSHRLFRKDYAPQPFSWAIRARTDQYPVGIVSIESKNSDEQQPISTLTRHIPSTAINSNSTRPPIYIPINAATSVQLTGDRYLSGWIRYEFASGSGGQGGSSDSDLFHLAARARQFSSFMILIGTMTGPDTFDPKHAMILQNKDEVLIDLITDVLPSAKQFKDAIASLSPEQQEFARAYRAMQLESSVFAIAIVQLKPQLETLLGLPSGALDKEIALTENLMKLFVEFQIPSDLLSYRNDDDSAAASNVTTFGKVEKVQGYVKSVMDVIESLKTQELEEEKQKAKARKVMFDESTIQPLASTSSRRFASATTAGATASMPGDSPTQRRALRSESPPTLDHASDKNADRSVDSMDQSRTQSSSAQQQRDDSPSSAEDFTLLPRLFDAKLEKFDTDGYLRSTVIKAWSSSWRLRRQKNLLTAPTSETLNKNDVALEKKKAFDLLDAISQSGALPIASSQLHVIIGVTHCFTDSLIATVIEDNVNPIAKAEKSTLMLASTIHGDMTPTDKMLGGGTELLDRLSSAFPELFTLPNSQQPHGAGEANDQGLVAES